MEKLAFVLLVILLNAVVSVIIGALFGWLSTKGNDTMHNTIEHRALEVEQNDGDRYLAKLKRAQEQLQRGDTLHIIARRFGLTKGEVKALKPRATGRFFIRDVRLSWQGDRPCVTAETFDPLTQQTNLQRLGGDPQKTAFFKSAPDAWQWLHTKRFVKSGAQKWPAEEDALHAI